MYLKNKLSLAVTAAICSLGAASVSAQQQQLDRVDITGSRIKSVQTEGVSPVVVISAEAIRAEGVRSVEQLLNNLPQVMADYGGSVSNGSTGTATVNLRNLGRERTLVLINGRRMTAGSPLEAAADLNQIPIALIKRVEVLTGGASAIYGSDAVAGVVNFILDDRFQGIQIEANHSFYNHQQGNAVASVVRARNFPLPGDKSADGKVNDFNLTLGGNFADGKGNAVIFLGYKKEEALLQSERDFSACALGPAGASFACTGSGTSFPARFVNFTPGVPTYIVANAAGGVRVYNGATDAYNFGPVNYFQRPSERYTFGALARYDLTDKVHAYAELGFHDDSTVAQIAPSGLFGVDLSGPNALRFENPLLSAEWRTALGLNAPGSTAEGLVFRRNIEGGGRQDDLRHTSYRGVAGIKGEVGPWNWDAFTQVGKVVYQETYKNDFSIARSTLALDVITDPATGQPACRAKVNGTDPNCVPYDIWSLGKVTPEALRYLQTPGFQKGFTSQSVVGFNVSGDLTDYGLKVPSAKNGVGIAFGAERRTEKLELSTDAAFTTGDLAGQGGPTLGLTGKYSVDELFGELKVPLIEQKPFAYLLQWNASYRNSKYSTGAKTDTYGTGLEWAPVREFKFRGSYQRAARAANIIELFEGQRVGLYNNDADPCAGATPTATQAECARTGVSAAQYGNVPDSPALQYNALFGGNPNLKPETSDSYTLGLVFSPVRNLTVSVDYFDIKIKDVISELSPTQTLNQCLATGSPLFCSLITRDRLGSLWATPQAQIVSTNANLGKYETQGVDIGADYGLGIGSMGRLDFSFQGTYLKKFLVEEIPGLGTYDCVGLYGTTCGNPLPSWRHRLRTTWATPWKVEAAVTWRHLASVDAEGTSSNPLLNAPVAQSVRTFGSRNYFDLALSYPLTKNIVMRGSVNNLFDKDPPLASTGAPFGNGNTYPQVYDTLGRRITLALTAKF